MLMFKVRIGDAGYGGPGDHTVKDGPTFSTLNKALSWLEKQGATELKYASFYRHLKPGESTLGEQDFSIVPVEIDP